MKSLGALALAFLFNPAFAAAPADNGFDRAVEEMLASDPQIQAQRALVDKSRARHLTTLSTFIPRLTAEGRDDQTSEPFRTRSQSVLAMGRLNLFRSGADWAALNAADWSIKKEEAGLRKIELISERESAQLLINVVQAVRRREVYKTLYSTNEDIQKIVELRYRRGLTALQEVQKATIERDNSLARLQDAIRAEADATALAQARLGEKPLPVDWPWRDILDSAKTKTLLSRRLDPLKIPKFQEGELAVTASEYRAKENFRRFLPTVDLSVGYGYVDYQAVHDTSWVTSLSLTIPLFDLSNNGAYRESVADRRFEEANRLRLRRETESDWTSSRNRLETAVTSAKSRQSNVAMAMSLYEDNRRRLQQGRSSVNDVAVDQNRLAEAELLAVDGWATAHVNFLEFCHSLGLRYAACR